MDQTSLHPPPQAEVRVSAKGADRYRNGHPWIFRPDVIDATGAGPGDVVRVVDHRRQFLGQAHYSGASQIALRMLSRNTEPVDFAARIATAALYRERVVADSTAYRLVHAEADGLPALMIDRYGDCFTVQAMNQGMDRALPTIVAALQEQFQPRAIVARNDSAVRTLEELPRETKVLAGNADAAVPVEMNGLRMEADLLHGQKTGVFLDQRENYPAVERFSWGRALDCFTCTGGFALHLARNCQSVEAVDSSESALATAARNVEANGLRNVTFREADAFELLASYGAARRSFETIVLDPPAFAKSRSQLEGAARGYKDINLRAMRLLSPEGILVTNSCSHHMSEAMLLEIVAQASMDAGRSLRVLERRTQALDHPILLTVPETHYLKCVILQVV